MSIQAQRLSDFMGDGHVAISDNVRIGELTIILAECDSNQFASVKGIGRKHMVMVIPPNQKCEINGCTDNARMVAFICTAHKKYYKLCKCHRAYPHNYSYTAINDNLFPFYICTSKCVRRNVEGGYSNIWSVVKKQVTEGTCRNRREHIRDRIHLAQLYSFFAGEIYPSRIYKKYMRMPPNRNVAFSNNCASCGITPKSCYHMVTRFAVCHEPSKMGNVRDVPFTYCSFRCILASGKNRKNRVRSIVKYDIIVSNLINDAMMHILPKPTINIISEYACDIFYLLKKTPI